VRFEIEWYDSQVLDGRNGLITEKELKRLLPTLFVCFLYFFVFSRKSQTVWTTQLNRSEIQHGSRKLPWLRISYWIVHETT
jgi:hypothetical protein